MKVFLKLWTNATYVLFQLQDSAFLIHALQDLFFPQKIFITKEILKSKVLFLPNISFMNAEPFIIYLIFNFHPTTFTGIKPRHKSASLSPSVLGPKSQLSQSYSSWCSFISQSSVYHSSSPAIMDRLFIYWENKPYLFSFFLSPNTISRSAVLEITAHIVTSFIATFASWRIRTSRWSALRPLAISSDK